MKQNNAMKILLEANKIQFSECNTNLEPGLQDIISGGVNEISGCYFLKKLTPSSFDIEEAKQQSIDATQLECEINHIHLGDYINRQSRNNVELLMQGLCYAIKLDEILLKINGFKIILAYVTDPITDCNIRFHKKRPKEEWLDDDLEKYEEAIICLES